MCVANFISYTKKKFVSLALKLINVGFSGGESQLLLGASVVELDLLLVGAILMVVPTLRGSKSKCFLSLIVTF